MIRLNDIIDKVQEYNKESDLAAIEKAYVFSAKVHLGQVRLSGEPYLFHPLEVAWILSELKLDDASIITGLLHDAVEDTLTTLEEIKELFNDEIAQLVDGVTKISKITFSTQEEKQAENFRKMLLAMSNDLRVILVKLTDRLHNMRTLRYHPRSNQIRIARETLEIYAPLAHRLGIAWIKSELEDLSLRYLQPDIYSELEREVAKAREEREAYVKEVIKVLKALLKKNGLKAKISGRPKHFYSIFKKMKSRHIDFEELYDLIAFRIILNSKSECYEALGYIHSEFTPIPDTFNDYIAMPKANGYQSLHTSAFGPKGERIEIQIRTEEMNLVAEQGIAAHWKYKEGRFGHDEDDIKFAWLRQILDTQKNFKDPKEFLQMVKMDLFPDEVYVFTPRGDVKSFPKGSTPLDFAYSIHTDVGHKCVGCRINGKLMPLKYQLNNGDIIEIITATDRKPSRDWLKIVKTSRARTKIRQWLKVEEQKRSLSLGREICEKTFRKYGLNFSKLTKSEDMLRVARDYSFRTLEDLIASVGYGKLSAKSVIGKLIPSEKLEETTLSEGERAKGRKKSREGVKVKDIEDVLVRFARCCNPLPGDDIVGFITRGRGVTVHTSDCPNLFASNPNRKIEVIWDIDRKTSHPARVRVICDDEKGMLAEISSSFSSSDINITSSQVRTTIDKKAICLFGIEVKDLEHLESALSSIRRIKNVIEVKRLRA